MEAANHRSPSFQRRLLGLHRGRHPGLLYRHLGQRPQLRPDLELVGQLDSERGRAQSGNCK